MATAAHTTRRSLFGAALALPAIVATATAAEPRIEPLHERPVRTLEVVSDNMLPTIQPGDFAFVNRRRGWLGRGVYVIDHDQDGTEALYRCWLSPKGEVRMASDHGSYGQDWTVSPEWFITHERGQVTGTFRRIAHYGTVKS